MGFQFGSVDRLAEIAAKLDSTLEGRISARFFSFTNFIICGCVCKFFRIFILLPELDVAVPDEECEVVPGHVGGLAGQEQDAVGRRWPGENQNWARTDFPISYVLNNGNMGNFAEYAADYDHLPELHAELQVAVGVGEGGEGDVRVAAELGRRYELVCSEINFGVCTKLCLFENGKCLTLSPLEHFSPNLPCGQRHLFCTLSSPFLSMRHSPSAPHSRLQNASISYTYDENESCRQQCSTSQI